MALASKRWLHEIAPVGFRFQEALGCLISYGRFEKIRDEPQEIDVSELLATRAEVTRNNARKHGLTPELAPKSVLEWYRIILNDPKAALPVMGSLSNQQRLALNLAQAEVRFWSVLHSIDAFKQERDQLFEERTNQEHDYQLYLRFARNRSLDKWTQDALKVLFADYYERHSNRSATD